MNGFDEGPQLAELRIVLALIEHGTVTNASDALGFSQSSLSHYLKGMRRRFDDELFVRVGNRMVPTPVAQRLGVLATKVLDVFDTELANVVEFDPATTRREFRIGMNEVGAIVLVPKLLRLLSDRAPHARLAPVVGDPATFAGALESTELDLAAGQFDGVDQFLCQQLLFKREFVCVARRDHPTIGDSITLEAFSEAPQIQITAAARTREWIDAELSKRTLQATISMSNQQVAAIPFIVAESDLIALIPRDVFKLFSPIVRIKEVRIPLSIPLIECRQYWHPRVTDDPAVKFFRETVFDASRFLRDD